MYDEKIEKIYVNILEKNLPDKDIEIFWYSWKNAILNAFKKNKNVINLFKLDIYSDKLNQLQKLKDFIGIQQLIQTYLERHSIICIENYIDSYNCNILDTHLKRWSKLTNKLDNLNKTVIKNSNYNFKLFNLYLILLNDRIIEVPENLTKEKLLDLIIEYKFTDLADISILNNKPHILDQILSIEDINLYIKNKYGIEFLNGTKGAKIIKKINKKLLKT